MIALADALEGSDEARITMVLSDRRAAALAEAEARKIPTHQLVDYRDGDEWMSTLNAVGCDLLALAGYLRLVPAAVVEAWRGRIINVHPALLPRHGGRGMHGERVHAAVLAARDAESGATVHLVDEEYDRGRVLGQGRVAIPPKCTPAMLAAAVLDVEHRLLPAAVRAAARAGHPVPFDFD